MFKLRIKISEEELSKVEMDNLLSKELKIMIVKMIKKLRRRMDEQRKKLEVVCCCCFYKRLENL